MLSDSMQELINEIKNQGKMYFLEGASELQIDEFEKEKDIKLPKKYREWLTYSDGGEFYLPAGVQFYGVAHKPMIDIDDSDRPNENFVVIGALATGDPILFEKNSEKISIYNHGDGVIEEDEIYEDLYAFIKDLKNILGIGV